MKSFIIYAHLFYWGWSIASGGELAGSGVPAAVASDACADGVWVDGVYHDKHVIKNIFQAINLNVDRKTNTLFFNYVPNPVRRTIFKSAFIDLETETLTNIWGLPPGMANAIDQHEGIVYIGSSDGIYKFNYTTKDATPYLAQGQNIFYMFFKDKLYFIEYPALKLYAINNGRPELVPGFEDFEPRLFTIDSNNEAMYVNKSGLFGLEKGNSVGKLKHYRANFLFSGVSLNAHGKPFFSGYKGMYTFGEDHTLKVAGHFTSASNPEHTESIFGVTFDKDDNMIYSYEDKIIKLTRSQTSCSPEIISPEQCTYYERDKGEFLVFDPTTYRDS